MRISLGRGTGKIVTLRKITVYNLSVVKLARNAWYTEQELIDHIKKLFGPSVRFID